MCSGAYSPRSTTADAILLSGKTACTIFICFWASFLSIPRSSCAPCFARSDTLTAGLRQRTSDGSLSRGGSGNERKGRRFGRWYPTDLEPVGYDYPNRASTASWMGENVSPYFAVAGGWSKAQNNPDSG